MTYRTNTPFDLEMRYGTRQLKSDGFGAALYLICVVGHLTSLIGLALVLIVMVVGLADTFASGQLQTLAVTVFVLTGLGTIAAVLFNRPAMFCAIRMLTAIEAVVSASREHKVRGWLGVFFDLFPFAVLIPPGDLLAVALMLLRIRNNTDHLEGRQAVVFTWSQRCLAFGAVAQYAGFALLVLTPTVLIFIPFGFSEAGAVGIGIVWNLVMLVGVVCVDQSLRSMVREMRRELGAFVNRRHGVSDPADFFLAGLSAGQVDNSHPTPETPAPP